MVNDFYFAREETKMHKGEAFCLMVALEFELRPSSCPQLWLGRDLINMVYSEYKPLRHGWCCPLTHLEWGCLPLSIS
jgi:hypothetical protein